MRASAVTAPPLATSPHLDGLKGGEGAIAFSEEKQPSAAEKLAAVEKLLAEISSTVSSPLQTIESVFDSYAKCFHLVDPALAQRFDDICFPQVEARLRTDRIRFKDVSKLPIEQARLNLINDLQDQSAGDDLRKLMAIVCKNYAGPREFVEWQKGFTRKILESLENFKVTANSLPDSAKLAKRKYILLALFYLHYSANPQLVAPHEKPYYTELLRQILNKYLFLILVSKSPEVAATQASPFQLTAGFYARPDEDGELERKKNVYWIDNKNRLQELVAANCVDAAHALYWVFNWENIFEHRRVHIYLSLKIRLAVRINGGSTSAVNKYASEVEALRKYYGTQLVDESMEGRKYEQAATWALYLPRDLPLEGNIDKLILETLLKLPADEPHTQEIQEQIVFGMHEALGISKWPGTREEWSKNKLREPSIPLALAQVASASAPGSVRPLSGASASASASRSASSLSVASTSARESTSPRAAACAASSASSLSPYSSSSPAIFSASSPSRAAAVEVHSSSASHVGSAAGTSSSSIPGSSEGVELTVFTPTARSHT